MKELRIAADLQMPVNAVTQTLSCIGRKGAGKTYLATLIAEQMLDAGAQVVVLDPVGNWFGLRVAADGKSKGKDIFVLGGEHGDVPLTPEGGARIARFLVEKRVSAVLDVSGFRQAERKRFAAALGEELFHLKKTQRTPVHLFLEEAQVFAPQRPGPDEARMLGAFEAIVRLGRNYGIGCTLVTQRPQSVNKEVLSQVECLCVLQVNGAHERKALEEWVQEAGADRKLVGELPGLHQGEGYVWSPSWLRTFRRVRFGKKTTFDASATPELGQAAKAATLAKVDVEALRTDLAEVVKEAEADDPKALRRRIAELEKELAKKLPPAPPVKPPKEVQVVRDAQLDRMEKVARDLLQVVEKVRPRLIPEHVTVHRMPDIHPPSPEEMKGAHVLDVARLDARRGALARALASHRASFPHSGDATSGGPVAKGELAILTATAQADGGATREELTINTGYKRSTRDTYIQRLAQRGLLSVHGDRIVITGSGLAALGPSYEPLPTGEALRDWWLARLPEGERKILELICRGRNPWDREDISEHTGFKRSTRDTYLQRLGARRLVISDRDGVRASPLLFDGGGR